MFRAAAFTDIGPRKKSNQDSCCIRIAESPYGDVAILAVCDGVGGLSSGELASTTVVHWLAVWFATKMPAYMKEGPYDEERFFAHVKEDWANGLETLNETIRVYGRETGAPLGTTCTVGLFCNEHYLVAHVGDSRIYRFHSMKPYIITEDQTYVAREVARGNIAPEEARHHPRRNIILQSVGTQSGIEPAFYEGEYEAGDVFIAACDGLLHEVYDEELCGAFGALGEASEVDIQNTCERIVRLNLERGENDNITVACLVSMIESPYVTGELGGSASFEEGCSSAVSAAATPASAADAPTAIFGAADAPTEVLEGGEYRG